MYCQKLLKMLPTGPKCPKVPHRLAAADELSHISMWSIMVNDHTKFGQLHGQKKRRGFRIQPPPNEKLIIFIISFANTQMFYSQLKKLGSENVLLLSHYNSTDFFLVINTNEFDQIKLFRWHVVLTVILAVYLHK